jgi:hypothetical protein
VTIGARHAHDLGGVPAEAQVGRSEQTIDDVVRLPKAIVDELGVTFGADNEYGWQFVLRDTRPETE